MSLLICPFKSKSYSLKNFKVTREFKNDSRYFKVFLKDEHIGSIDTHKSLTTYQNGKEIYFLIGYNGIKMGTIAFSCLNEEFVWKIKYVKLKEIPKGFIRTRKVIIEKFKEMFFLKFINYD